MEKILVMGVSAGAGKSTFAKKLGSKLHIEVTHLDALFWKPGWIQTGMEEFASSQREIVHGRDRWIVEGNYTGTYEIRAEHADTIIYLELPLYICLYRVFKRWLKNRGKTRPDLGVGCPEKLDWEFISFICTTYYPRKRKMRKWLQSFQADGEGRAVYFLKGKKRINSFIENVHEQ
ncbi:topology modulation protein [Virgibacillus halophilus]|uniref:Topology modulation protein n=1 Tax=Tigheibacillus halophilus TaxID=361280 RepID=A0ABU5C4W5_9BACI|nr:topology modulation protein [Virgibacillus halophilus]